MAPAWDIFIAYASPHRAWADALHAALCGRGLRVFVDHRVLQPGDDWPRALQQALARSACIVALVPPAAAAAFFQRDELLFALDALRDTPPRLRLVPVYIAGARPGADAPYGLRALQHLVAPALDDLAAVAGQLAALAVRCTDDDDSGAGPVPGATEADDAQSRRVAPAISARMAELRRDVRQLTEEQFRVIQQLRWLRRVRISGCAGSGKTLIAAEKAVRLAQALSFGAWVQALADDAGGDPGTAGWSHLLEPGEAMLTRARQRLGEAGGAFDAVIVDEAQDFRDAWWPLVEAALPAAPAGILYLFHDDQQTLLPRRDRYPVDEPLIDLSRNCRNAGRVYELMRRFDSTAPRTEPLLLDQGQAVLRVIEAGAERAALADELQQLALAGLLPSTTVLWSGAEPLASCPLAGFELEVGVALGWQDEVQRRLQAVYTQVQAARGIAGLRLPAQPPAQALAGLSAAPVPSAADVALVQACARQLMTGDVPAAGRRMLKFGWVAEGGRWRLRRTVGQLAPAERARALARFFRIEGWAEGIGRPQAWRVTPFFDLPRSAAVPLYAVGDFKGLEADVVVLVMRGKTVAHRSSTYVGVSRARAVLRVLADTEAVQVFPRDHPWR